MNTCYVLLGTVIFFAHCSLSRRLIRKSKVLDTLDAKPSSTLDIGTQDEAIKAVTLFFKSKGMGLNSKEAKKYVQAFVATAEDVICRADRCATKESIKMARRKVKAVLVTLGGDITRALQCIDAKLDVVRTDSHEDLQRMFANADLNCTRTQFKWVDSLGAGVENLLPTEDDKDNGDIHTLKGDYLTLEGRSATVSGIRYYGGGNLKVLRKCWEDDNSKTRSFGNWLKDSSNDDVKCGSTTKRRAKAQLENERVVYLDDAQRGQYTVSIIDQRIAVPAFGPGPSLGPRCPDFGKVDSAILMKKQHPERGETWRPLFDNLPIGFDLQLNSKPWPLRDCGDSQTLIFALRGGVLLASIHIVGVFHHSSLFAGHPVASAGKMHFKKANDGMMRLETIDSHTGHYKVPRSSLALVLGKLYDLGLDDKKNWCGEFAVQCAGFNKEEPQTCFEEFPEAFPGLSCP